MPWGRAGIACAAFKGEFLAIDRKKDALRML
jgi:hypothetical protein